MKALTERLREAADSLADAYGDDLPPEGELSLPDRCYFLMHEAADELWRLNR